MWIRAKEEARVSGLKETSQIFDIQIGMVSTPCNNHKILAIKLRVFKIINASFVIRGKHEQIMACKVLSNSES